MKEHKLLDTVISQKIYGNINQLYMVACLLTNYKNGPLVKAWAKEVVYHRGSQPAIKYTPYTPYTHTLH